MGQTVKNYRSWVTHRINVRHIAILDLDEAGKYEWINDLKSKRFLLPYHSKIRAEKESNIHIITEVEAAEAVY